VKYIKSVEPGIFILIFLLAHSIPLASSVCKVLAQDPAHLCPAVLPLLRDPELPTGIGHRQVVAWFMLDRPQMVEVGLEWRFLLLE
jgi:hypothetical protein